MPLIGKLGYVRVRVGEGGGKGKATHALGHARVENGSAGAAGDTGTGLVQHHTRTRCRTRAHTRSHIQGIVICQHKPSHEPPNLCSANDLVCLVKSVQA